ncbi:GNAT family N-acetyltransferase [Fusibacter paucivorans]|uniref:GNAT family N-acetyltransferase n=1 Tax=Fusibacter paucivorans TaxID=76009 RepID=A0ABS5PVH3_9FIRM|nr:GNAT family N-acetyltransferase [Fusibacter paucivorans]MBS7528501.1 GNAT family N-acetyltransferase [Fusibacter paucivorans]
MKEKEIHLAVTVQNEAVGCCAFRPMNDSTAEIKRMYAKEKGCGIGALILSHLEREAKQMGYAKIWLETRRINENAVRLYREQGYQCIPNYGKYVGNTLAICFEKIL